MIMIYLSALTLGFSGAMMPGPLLTYTIKQSLNKGPLSGVIITIGHALLEMLLIALIFLGFNIVLQSDTAQKVIGIVGGLMLLYMGADMIWSSFKNKIKIELDGGKTGSRNMVLSGLLISAANPYFLLWWAIVGLGFLLDAYKVFGIAGIVLFYLGHISADFIWYGSISAIIGTTRKFISQNIYRIIIALLGCVLVYFGGSFVIKAIF